MKLIVGLGNLGKEYENTRHNIGFMAIDNYLKNESFKEKFSSLYIEKTINENKVIFMKPTTFMNNSGIAVKQIMDYFKISVEDVLIIYDDMDFNIGTYKIKKDGSSGGHNGMKSIINYLGTEDVKRLRIGISKHDNDAISYVLGKFSTTEKEIINNILDKVNNIIDDFIVMDFERLMSKYN